MVLCDCKRLSFPTCAKEFWAKSFLLWFLSIVQQRVHNSLCPSQVLPESTTIAFCLFSLHAKKRLQQNCVRSWMVQIHFPSLSTYVHRFYSMFAFTCDYSDFFAIKLIYDRDHQNVLNGIRPNIAQGDHWALEQEERERRAGRSLLKWRLGLFLLC